MTARLPKLDRDVKEHISKSEDELRQFNKAGISREESKMGAIPCLHLNTKVVTLETIL